LARLVWRFEVYRGLYAGSVPNEPERVLACGREVGGWAAKALFKLPAEMRFICEFEFGCDSFAGIALKY
jgi:hypothetical protein